VQTGLNDGEEFMLGCTLHFAKHNPTSEQNSSLLQGIQGLWMSKERKWWTCQQKWKFKMF